MRHGRHDRRADRLPGPAGPRRRHAHAAGHDDHDPGGRAGADRPADGHPRRPDAARADRRPDPRRLADRHRELALDLPDQRADRRGRAGLRRVRAAEGQPEPSESFDFVGMLMLSPGLALFLFGVSSLPEAGTLRRGQGVAADAGRRGARGRLRPLLVQAPAPAARPAPVPQPRADHRDGDDVRVHHRVHGRRPAVPELLPAGPRRVHARRRSADGAAGHRRDDHDADRRHAGRQDPGRPDRAVRAGARSRSDSSRSPRSAPTRRTGCCAARCS